MTQDPGSPRTILLIDDDRALREVLTEALGVAGYQVIVAENGREGLVHCAKTPVDLVLTDLFMPEMEGLETIRAFQQSVPGVPIIAMSAGGAQGRSEFLEIARRLGARQVLPKPFAVRDLLQAIAEALPRRTETP